MQNTRFKFEFSEKAALHNGHLLQHHGYDLASALHQQQYSPLPPASEFKAVKILHQLFHWHPPFGSASSNIDTEKLLHCNYGFTMRQLIHSIVTIWLQHPNYHYCDLKG